MGHDNDRQVKPGCWLIGVKMQKADNNGPFLGCTYLGTCVSRDIVKL